MPFPYAANSVGIPLLFNVYDLSAAGAVDAAAAPVCVPIALARAVANEAPEAVVLVVAPVVVEVVAGFVACWVCSAIMRLWMLAMRLLTPSIPTALPPSQSGRCLFSSAQPNDP
ncbi:hypothetical protein GCM10010435_37820 [Winogradskya consettensis]|uniref:Uncharacterized protein n=1 Tax=Winogradskya consettensis TaxID=113560 RepID=A0A919VYW7_9ACTN|nr:hypothetical protein Aco04nite_88270 [Actinoplanes consettensis]